MNWESNKPLIDKYKPMGRWNIEAHELLKEVKDAALAKRLARMKQKQERLWIRSAKTIKGILGRQLFGSIILDRNVIKDTGMLFSSTPDVHKVVNADLASDLHFDDLATAEITLKWATGQFICSTINFKYPTIKKDKDAINMTKYFKDNIIINYWVQKSIIDDEVYTIIKEFIKTFNIYYNPKKLTIGLIPRNSHQHIWDLTLESLLESEIEQWYVNKTIWDKSRKFSYTHMLRRNLNLNLQTWQRELITNWRQYNFVAGSRRIWKSFLSGFIWYRELYRKGSGYGDRNRQVLYVTLSDNKAWQPFQYMMQMTEKDRALGYVSVNTSNKEFTCHLTWTKLLFITASARWGAASYGADLVIVDEAAMIPNEFWDDLLPIIVQEWASVFAISTINEWVKQNWFYKYLLKWEMWDDTIQSIRVTIDDNELLGDVEKAAMRDALKDNQMKYWTQLYSIFPSGSNVFNLNGTIKTIEQIDKREMVIIGYDPAKLWDNASFVVVDPTTFETVEEHIMKWVPYMEQKTFLENLKKRYYQSVVVMDRSWVWEWVYEIFWNLIDVSVRYKANWDAKITPLWYWTVSKWDLIDTLQLFFENYWLKISDQLENLIKELKHFKVLADRGRVIQYGWVWFTDDSVNALALVTFYLKYISWITQPLDIWRVNDSILLWSNWDIIEQNNIYEEYNYQSTYKNFIY